MEHLPLEERHQRDYESMMQQLEQTVIPMFYHQPQEWALLMRRAMDMAVNYFDSERMAIEYYTRLYNPASL